MLAQAYAAVDGGCSVDRGVVIDVDRAVDRPGIIRCLSGGYMNGAVDLGGAITINRDITSGKRQDRRKRGNDSIAARRSHKGSPARPGSRRTTVFSLSGS